VRILKTLGGVLSIIGVIIGMVIIVMGLGMPTRQVFTANFQIEMSDKITQESIKPQEQELPTGKRSDWNLLLVNAQHHFSDGNVELGNLNNGYQLDKRIIPYWNKLNEAAQQAGITLTMVSAFRSVATQKSLVQQNIQANINAGMSEEEATKATMSVMQEPGSSEHATGLAFDVVGTDYFNRTDSSQLLVAEFSNDISAKWLATKAPEFGFILRYPKGREDITGIDFEPWHFRFVGVEVAQFITKHNLTLEEYIDLLEKAGR
jgi:D-alanyl-D-alanine carboxypeptidase